MTGVCGEKVSQLKQCHSVVYQEARALRPSKWQSLRRWLTLLAGRCNAVFGARMRFLQGDCKKKKPRTHGEGTQGVGEGCPNGVCGDKERWQLHCYIV